MKVINANRLVNRAKSSTLLLATLGLFAPISTFPLFAQEEPAPTDVETLDVEDAPRASQIERETADSVLPRLLNGQLSVQDAWREESLTPASIVYLLEERMHNWGGFGSDKDELVRHALCKMLVEHASTRYGHFINSARASAKVRVWVGDYLQSIRDKRAVDVLEKVVSAYPANQSTKASDPIAYQALERLGWYYSATGQPQLAIKSYLRIPDVYEQAYTTAADGLLMAARLAYSIGDKAQAQMLYAQIPAYGNGHTTGAALRDQADRLLEENKPEEAIRVLTRETVTGEGAAPARVVVTAMLAIAHYRAGRFDTAKEKAAEVKQAFDALNEADKNYPGIAQYVQFAQGVVTWSEKWKSSPLIVMPEQINITRAQWEEAQRSGQPIKTRLSVRTQRMLPLQLSIRLPKSSAVPAKAKAPASNQTTKPAAPAIKPIRARLTAGDWTGQRHFYYEQEVAVEIMAAELLNWLNYPVSKKSTTTPRTANAIDNNAPATPFLIVWVKAAAIDGDTPLVEAVSGQAPLGETKRYEVQVPIVMTGAE